jgi:hypothetical protein
VFVKAASASGTRSMNLFMNGFQFARITANATDNPRPTGTEFGPFLVEMAPGDNTLELKDDLGTAELDVLQMRTNNHVPDFTYFAQDISGCTGNDDCTDQTWGIDVNANTGHLWSASGGENGGPAKLYVKVASPSGTRSMGLTLNGTSVGVVTTTSTASPRPTGSELGPFNVTLLSGSNTVELLDNQGTAELDVHSVRIAESRGDGAMVEAWSLLSGPRFALSSPWRRTGTDSRAPWP